MSFITSEFKNKDAEQLAGMLGLGPLVVSSYGLYEPSIRNPQKDEILMPSHKITKKSIFNHITDPTTGFIKPIYLDTLKIRSADFTAEEIGSLTQVSRKDLRRILPKEEVILRKMLPDKAANIQIGNYDPDPTFTEAVEANLNPNEEYVDVSTGEEVNTDFPAKENPAGGPETLEHIEQEVELAKAPAPEPEQVGPAGEEVAGSEQRAMDWETKLREEVNGDLNDLKHVLTPNELAEQMGYTQQQIDDAQGTEDETVSMAGDMPNPNPVGPGDIPDDDSELEAARLMAEDSGEPFDINKFERDLTKTVEEQETANDANITRDPEIVNYGGIQFKQDYIHEPAISVFFGLEPAAFDITVTQERSILFDNWGLEKAAAYAVKETKALIEKNGVDMLVFEQVYPTVDNKEKVLQENFEILQLYTISKNITVKRTAFDSQIKGLATAVDKVEDITADTKLQVTFGDLAAAAGLTVPGPTGGSVSEPTLTSEQAEPLGLFDDEQFERLDDLMQRKEDIESKPGQPVSQQRGPAAQVRGPYRLLKFRGEKKPNLAQAWWDRRYMQSGTTVKANINVKTRIDEPKTVKFVSKESKSVGGLKVKQNPKKKFAI